MTSTIPAHYTHLAKALEPCSATPAPCAQSREPLNLDVLRNVFERLDAPDILNVARVSTLWHAAATSRPHLAPWFAASNRLMQDFVRNKKRSADTLIALPEQPAAMLPALLKQQRFLQLERVDEGLNDSRMHQAFAAMPHLKHLKLGYSAKSEGKGTAVTWGNRAPTIHDRVRQQRVPPQLWTGELPAHITQLDLSHFALLGGDTAGRPYFENTLMAGLLRSLEGHPNITHLTLGECNIDQMTLPPKLTHLVLSRKIKVHQPFALPQHVVATQLFRALPPTLTHLIAGDKCSLMDLPDDASWPAYINIKRLSLSVGVGDLTRLQSLLRAPLESLQLTCTKGDGMAARALGLKFPDTLAALDIDVSRVSSAWQKYILASVPSQLTRLTVKAREADDVAPLVARLTTFTQLRDLQLTLRTNRDATLAAELVDCLPKTFTRLAIQSVQRTSPHVMRDGLPFAQQSLRYTPPETF